jgi:hypothetical protein
VSDKRFRVVAFAGAFLAVLGLILGGGALAPWGVDAQSVFVNSGNNSFSGDITADEGTVVNTTEGRGGAAVVLTGTWVGTIVPEVSINGGTTYVATQFYNILTRTVVDSTTANGSFVILGVGGTSHVRVRMDAYTSGTATAVVRSTAGSFSLPAARDITLSKSISSAAGTTSVTVWTPASGKKPRVYGFHITASADSTITVQHSGAETAFFTVRAATNVAPTFVSFPEGFLVNTADATISMKPAQSAQIFGGIWGRDE